MTEEFAVGDIVTCPHCKKDYVIEHIDEIELDDADEFFEHVTTCNGW